MDLEIYDQQSLPHLDSYFKSNEFIQNFELAAAMDTSQHRVFDTLMSCLQSLKQYKKDYLYLKANSKSKIIKLNLDFFMKRYINNFDLSSIKKSDIVKAIDSLGSIRVLKETDDEIKSISVFPTVTAKLKTSIIEIEINENYGYESLTPTNGNFTKLMHSKQIELRSVYARILYQYFLSHLWRVNKHYKEFELEQLQRILGILDQKGKYVKGKTSYSNIGQFRRRCLDTAIESINKNTDIHIDIEDIKRGRKILGFKLTGFKKKLVSENVVTDINVTDNQLEEFRPKKEHFKDLMSFVKHLKINYNNRAITNSIPGYNPNDKLIINQNGYLAMESLDGKRYNLVKNSASKDKDKALELWKWLYSNINKVGMFKHIVQLDLIKYENCGSNIKIQDELYEILDIKDDATIWKVVMKNRENVKSAFNIPKSEVNITDYLNNIKVSNE